jgi:hypothetical protein
MQDNLYVLMIRGNIAFHVDTEWLLRMWQSTVGMCIYVLPLQMGV